MIDALSGLAGLLGFSVAVFRFLFSPAYREKTRARWAQQREMQTMQEVLGAIIAMVLVIVLPLLLLVSFL